MVNFKENGVKKNKTDKINIEKKLLLEEMDPITLEDIPETDDLDLEGSSISAANLVKASYSNLQSGKAIVREKAVIIVLIGTMAIIGMGVWFIVYGIINYSHYPQYVFFSACISGAFISTIAGGVLIFVCKRYIKLFDVYFFRQKGKYIIFYQNSKYTVYYRNRTEEVCINNKKRIEKRYSDDIGDIFMNAKLGFNRMIGEMKVKETKQEYKIKTKGSKMYGKTTLWLDNDMNPKKILISGICIYKFMGDLPDKIKIPKELLDICDERNIARPPDDDKIEYI
jgi:hypothetical protein